MEGILGEEYFIFFFGEEKYIRLPRDAFFFSARVAAHAQCVFVVHSFVSAAVRRVGWGSGVGDGRVNNVHTGRVLRELR